MDQTSRQQLRAAYRSTVKQQASRLIPRGKDRDRRMLTPTGRRREVVERIGVAIAKGMPKA